MRPIILSFIIIVGSTCLLQAVENSSLPEDAQAILEKADIDIAEITQEANEDTAKVLSKSIKSLQRLVKKAARKDPETAALLNEKIKELNESVAKLSRPKLLIEDGVSIGFLGDSITRGGWADKGYIKRIISGLKANGIAITPYPAGVGGHKSNDMLARLEKDVLSKKPDWMTLSCGVNDVWHGERGVPLDQYKINITAIVDQAQAAGVKVMLFTATVIGEDLPNPKNVTLAPYNEFLHALAKERKFPIADLNADMQTFIKASANPTGKLLTSDGVHMNDAGNILMATGVLRAFGLDNNMIKKAEAAWLE